MIGKIQPQAIELEKVVLGAMMLEREKVDLAMNILTPDHFYDDKQHYNLNTIDTIVIQSFDQFQQINNNIYIYLNIVGVLMNALSLFEKISPTNYFNKVNYNIILPSKSLKINNDIINILINISKPIPENKYYLSQEIKKNDKKKNE